MTKKYKLKKYLFITFIIVICLLIISLVLESIKYHTYTKNFNNKIVSIVNKIKEDYKDISEDEIFKILNSKDTNNSIFKKYGIDVLNDSIVLENENNYHIFLIVNLCFLSLSFIILIVIFLRYNKNKDKELEEITKYIERINNKDYSYDLDKMSEDELSILRNEIYKTTVMLKEDAINSLKDKEDLKNSLEDISHQIKTPLTSILIMLDNLIDNVNMDNKLKEDFLRNIKREVVNINFFIQAILKLARFDANSIKFIKKEKYLKDIINEAVLNVAVLCDFKNIKIIVKGDKELKLLSDYKWQVEAITNILKNCVEHSSNNSKIFIDYSKNNIYTLVKIKDLGEGISSKDLPHIFERFYKKDDSSNDSIGIGLALAKMIIENDNGRISVESNDNGTIFYIKYFNL